MSLMHVILLNPSEDQEELLARIDGAIAERGARRISTPVEVDPDPDWGLPAEADAVAYAVEVEP